MPRTAVEHPMPTLSEDKHSQQGTESSSEANITGPVESRYVGGIVLGALDGSMTTFAVVAAATGAGQPSAVVLIIGLANLLASGASMALGSYLGTKSEEEFREKHRRREEYETERFPETEKDEVRRIFAEKGFQGSDLERAVEIITSDKKIWVDTMMRDELRISPERRNPWYSGLAMFTAFVSIGAIPVIPYVLSLYYAPIRGPSFTASLALTFLAIFGVGTLRSIVTGARWWAAGIEMTVIGAVAASIAYLIGHFVGSLLGL